MPQPFVASYLRQGPTYAAAILLERAQEMYGPHPAGEFWVPRRLGGSAPSLAEAARMDAEEAAARAARRARPAGAPE